MDASARAERTTDPVPPDDRAFLYGDGLFETLLAIDGRLCWLSLHRSRLLDGARRLGISCHWPSIESALTAAAPEEGCHILRLTLSRGSGARGYGPSGSEPRIRIRSSTPGRDPRQPQSPARLGLSTVQLGDQPLLAGLKHCNRLENVMAAAEATAQGVDDVLMMNARGGVQCSATANVFAVDGDRLLTPDCERSGIAGTRRRLIMEDLAPSLGLEVMEKHLPAKDWRTVDGAFLCNSVIGIRSIGSIDEHTYAKSDVLESLQQTYFQRLTSCSGR